MQAVARLLDDRDLVKGTQKALDERHARDDRIDYIPAGGEEVKTLAKKVEGMKEQLKGIGSTGRTDSPRPSRSPRRAAQWALDDVPDDLPSSKSGHVCRDGSETC